MNEEGQSNGEPSDDLLNKIMSNWKVASAVLVGLIVVASVIGTWANVDKPACTTTASQDRRIVNVDGACAGGAWGQWTIVSENTDSVGTRTVAQERIYTGMRTLRSVFDSTTTVNSCTGTTITGTVITESTACQIRQTRTLTYRGGDDPDNPDPGGDNPDGDDPDNPDPDPDIDTIDTTVTDVGPTITDQDVLNSRDEILAYRRGLIDSRITADPALIRSGTTSRIHWSSVEMQTCSVTENNPEIDDRWTALASPAAGEETSEISRVTIYTLTCIDAVDGGTSVESAIVNVLPDWSEQ